MFIKLLSAVILFSLSLVFAGPKEFYYKRYIERASLFSNDIHEMKKLVDLDSDLFVAPRLNPSTPEVTLYNGTFKQQINHEDQSDNRVFDQRYFVDTKYSEDKKSPVFLYICGEATCSPRYLNGAISEHAKKFNGILIALEHRYYGESQPFDSFTTDNLKYLTLLSALKDIAEFQKKFSAKNNLSGKWIVIGGSYAGSLAAYYRQKFPELAAGALASSGPVRAEANFDAYDKHVTQVVGEECADAMREVVKNVEDSFNTPEELQYIKIKFMAEEVKENNDFLYVIADIGAVAVQYGYHEEFCSKLLAGDPLEGYASFARKIFNTWQMTAINLIPQGAVSTDPKDYVDGFGMRQWFYQSCREYGYWQNAHSNPELSTRSSRINSAYHKNLCLRLFGITDDVQVEATNKIFYEPLLKGETKNIFYTNGSNDPWSVLSITEVPESNPDLSTYVIKEASHCDDLGRPTLMDSTDLKLSRSMFQKLVYEWL